MCVSERKRERVCERERERECVCVWEHTRTGERRGATWKKHRARHSAHTTRRHMAGRRTLPTPLSAQGASTATLYPRHKGGGEGEYRKAASVGDNALDIASAAVVFERLS